MSTRKVRCSYCKKYVLRDDAVRVGILAFCSDEHRQNYRFEQQRKQQVKNRKHQINPDLRQSVINADGGCCRFCGTTSNLHVHHVKYRSEGGKDESNNLITLCVDHHGTVHSDKKRYQKLCLSIIEIRENYGFIRISIPAFELSERKGLDPIGPEQNVQTREGNNKS
jgi:hypothetical protein